MTIQLTELRTDRRAADNKGFAISVMQHVSLNLISADIKDPFFISNN